MHHVAPHIDSKQLIKLDIKDFFASIETQFVFKIFKEIGYSNKVSRILASLVTLNGTLPQGAITSPILSNIFMEDFDHKLSIYCNSKELNYTRYADDIVISGNDTDTLISIVDKISSGVGLQINNDKTHYYKTPNTPRLLTGLSLHNGRIRLPKAMRRRIRTQSYLLLRFLEELKPKEMFFINDKFTSMIDDENIADPLFIERIMGKLRYWQYIPSAIENSVLIF